MKRHDVLINNRHIAYWEANKERPKSLILIHGLGGDHRGLIDFSACLSDYRLLIPDLPGYGLSEPLSDKHSVENYVRFLESFRKKVGIQKFSLIGHSFGGAIALMYARLHPERVARLALLNPVLENTGTVSLVLGNTYVKLASLFPDKICHFLLSNKTIVYLTDISVMTAQGKARRKRILSEDYENYRQADTRVLKESFTALDTLMADAFTLSREPDLLVVVGSKDRLVSTRQISKFFKPTSIKTVSGGHLFPLEDPKTAGEIVGHFLR